MAYDEEDIRFKIRADDSQFAADLAALRAQLGMSMGASYTSPAIGRSPVAFQTPSIPLSAVAAGAGGLVLQDLSIGASTLGSLRLPVQFGLPALGIDPQFPVFGGVGAPQQMPRMIPSFGEFVGRRAFSAIGLGNLVGRTPAPWMSESEFSRLSMQYGQLSLGRAGESAGVGISEFLSDAGIFTFGAGLARQAAVSLGVTSSLGLGAASIAGGIGVALAGGYVANELVFDPIKNQIAQRRAVEDRLIMGGRRILGRDISTTEASEMATRIVGGTFDQFFAQFQPEDPNLLREVRRNAGGIVSTMIGSGALTGTGSRFESEAQAAIRAVSDLMQGLRLPMEAATQFAAQLKIAGNDITDFSAKVRKAKESNLDAQGVTDVTNITASRVTQLTQDQQRRQLSTAFDELIRNQEDLAAGRVSVRQFAQMQRMTGISSVAAIGEARNQVMESFRQTPSGQFVDRALAGFMFRDKTDIEGAIAALQREGPQAGMRAASAARTPQDVFQVLGIMRELEREPRGRAMAALTQPILSIFNMGRLDQIDQRTARGFAQEVLGIQDEAALDIFMSELTRQARQAPLSSSTGGSQAAIVERFAAKAPKTDVTTLFGSDFPVFVNTQAALKLVKNVFTAGEAAINRYVGTSPEAIARRREVAAEIGLSEKQTEALFNPWMSSTFTAKMLGTPAARAIMNVDLSPQDQLEMLKQLIPENPYAAKVLMASQPTSKLVDGRYVDIPASDQALQSSLQEFREFGESVQRLSKTIDQLNANLAAGTMTPQSKEYTSMMEWIMSTLSELAKK